MMRVQAIPLSQIEPVVEKPPAAFVRSLASHGQLQPVRLHPTGQDHPAYQITAGRDRIAGLRQLGAETVDAVIEEVDPVRHALVLLAENGHRRPNPVAEAQAVLVLHQQGYADEEIAAETCLNLGKVRQRLALIQHLHPKLLERLRVGEISLNAAQRALKLSTERQEALAQQEGRITAKEVEQQLRQYKQTLIELEDIPTPQLEDEGYLAGLVEQVAVKLVGLNRQILLQAAEILRKQCAAAA